MTSGPLIPGWKEFDGPRKRTPRIVVLFVALLVIVGLLVGVGGFVGGVGPLRALGWVSDPLLPLAYRPTTDPRQIQVSVALPSRGFCLEDDVSVIASEGDLAVEVTGSWSRPRTSSCAATGVTEDHTWVDVSLRADLGVRTVVRAADGEPLPRESD